MDKGYIYDEETRLYYLKTRYYDPEIGRFISPDSIDYQSPESINGLNLYAYCGNDPINMVDPTGHIAFFVVTAIIGAIIGFGLAAYKDYKEDGVWFSGSAGSYIGYTLGGAVIGAIAGLLSSAALVGRLTASCGAVKSGVVTLYNMIKFGGLGAASCMIYDNLKKSVHYTTHVFGQVENYL